MWSKLVDSLELMVNSKKKSINYELFTMNSKGQSLMELVVVVAVIVVVVGALTFATIASLRNASFSKNQAQATRLAQEGIERVRTGRDRNKPILHNQSLGNVISWDGNNQGLGKFWDYQINGNCGDSSQMTPTYCFFNVNAEGELSYLTAYGPTATQSTLPQNAERIPPSDPMFRRAVIISDDSSTRAVQKTVTVIVTWTDISGPHESRLTTILRKI